MKRSWILGLAAIAIFVASCGTPSTKEATPAADTTAACCDSTATNCADSLATDTVK